MVSNKEGTKNCKVAWSLAKIENLTVENAMEEEPASISKADSFF